VGCWQSNVGISNLPTISMKISLLLFFLRRSLVVALNPILPYRFSQQGPRQGLKAKGSFFLFKNFALMSLKKNVSEIHPPVA